MEIPNGSPANSFPLTYDEVQLYQSSNVSFALLSKCSSQCIGCQLKPSTVVEGRSAMTDVQCKEQPYHKL